MNNELARPTGISLCLAKIPAKRAVFFSYDSSSPVNRAEKLINYAYFSYITKDNKIITIDNERKIIDMQTDITWYAGLKKTS